jgi:hypothetical protein
MWNFFKSFKFVVIKYKEVKLLFLIKRIGREIRERGENKTFKKCLLLLLQLLLLLLSWIRGSSVGIATRYGLDGPGIEYQ